MEKIWRVLKKFVPLHPQIRNGGSVAQLNRASDYGSEGCGFESRRNHKQKTGTLGFIQCTSFSFHTDCHL